MATERIEIEDAADCRTCSKRHESVLEMMQEVRLAILAKAYCRECGREYPVLVDSRDVEAHS